MCRSCMLAVKISLATNHKSRLNDVTHVASESSVISYQPAAKDIQTVDGSGICSTSSNAGIQLHYLRPGTADHRGN